MIIDLQKYEKLVCFFECKERKGFFELIEDIFKVHKDIKLIKDDIFAKITFISMTGNFD